MLPADITSKAEIIKENKARIAAEFGGREFYIQDMIENDVQKGVEKLNGEDNQKMLKSLKLPKTDYRL